MDITQIDFVITQLGFYMNAILIPIATAIIARKAIKEKKSTGKYNPIRLLIVGIFLSFSILGLQEFRINILTFEMPLIDEIFGEGIEAFGLYSFLIGTMVTLGLTIVFYGNRWEEFYYSAYFFYGGMIITFLLTGYDDWLENYIITATLIGVSFLYYTAFRVKDNGALGLAIFFTIAFGTIIIDNHWVSQISVIIYSTFIMIFSLGYFKPFKEVEK